MIILIRKDYYCIDNETVYHFTRNFQFNIKIIELNCPDKKSLFESNWDNIVLFW